MGKFLRYNSRHHFYWRLGHGRNWRPRYAGDERVTMGRPQLNPISSTYGNGIKNISVYEPLWLFRLRQRLFAFAGRQRCPRRGESWHGMADESPLPDTWDMGPDGNRTCSYCGSIHPDDFIEMCERTLDDPEYSIDGTDKSYKVYVRQPGVRNASEGAIKFYMQHAHENPTPEQQAIFRTASRVSRERFNEMMSQRFPKRENA